MPVISQLSSSKSKTKLRALSPRTNYTDRATAACRRCMKADIYVAITLNFLRLKGTFVCLRIRYNKKQTNSVASVRERTIPTERPPLVNGVSAKFADRGCRVVNTKDPCGRILGFQDRSRCFFLSIISSIVLTRLTGPRSRPITSQKIW
jgi:hypothetical protein